MERKRKFETADGVDIKPFYGPQDGSADHDRDLGEPGEYPYTRGIYPTMYRGRFWTMRQYAGYGSAEDSNRRFHYLLRQGQTGLSVAFDLPTQMGYDSDHPMAQAEVGKAGGTTQNDILKEYLARGTYIFPPQPSLRLVTDIFAYCADHLPRWNPISISGYHIREAGATAAQEVAVTIADGATYVEAAGAAGLDVDRIAPRLSFFFAAQMDLLEEVAKFRAARGLGAGR